MKHTKHKIRICKMDLLYLVVLIFILDNIKIIYFKEKVFTIIIVVNTKVVCIKVNIKKI